MRRYAPAVTTTVALSWSALSWLTLRWLTLSWLALSWSALRVSAGRPVASPARGRDGDRGDVPGWVLVTVMTAGMVIALWAVAEPQLEAMFSTALSAVKGP